MVARVLAVAERRRSMRLVLRWCPPFAVAGILLFALSTPFWAGQTADMPDSKASDKKISDVTKTIINRGADLFNVYRDYAGCYRYYQGGLTALRGMLDGHKELQDTIDKALAEAERAPSVTQRAFVLRRALGAVWDKFNPKKATKDRVIDRGPEDKAPRDKPKDKPPRDVPKDFSKDVKDLPKPAPDKDKPAPDKDKPADKPVKDKDKPATDKDKPDDKPVKDKDKPVTDKDKPVDDKDKPIKDKGKSVDDKDKPIKDKDKPVTDKGEANDKGNKAGAKVTGHVTYKGKPLPSGMITFTALDRTGSYSSAIAADGTYAMDGMKPGKYAIAVAVMKPVKPAADKAAAKDVFPIPEKYADPKKSGIEAEVKAGENDVNLDLQ
jgi:hypothetical protein